MGMAPFPTLWRCLKCRSPIVVDVEKGINYRAPLGFTEIYCSCCMEWGEPVAPNGRLCA